MKSKPLLIFALLTLFIVLQVISLKGATQRFDFAVSKQIEFAQRGIEENLDQVEAIRVHSGMTQTILNKYYLNSLIPSAIVNVLIVSAISIIPFLKPKKQKNAQPENGESTR